MSDPEEFESGLEALRASADAAKARMSAPTEAAAKRAPKPARGDLEALLAGAQAAAAAAPPAKAPTCSGCGGALGSERAEPSERRELPVRCLECRRKGRAAIVSQFLPEYFAATTLETPELSTWVRSARAIAATRRALHEPRVTFVGPAGSGKTTLALAAIRARYVETGERFRIQPSWDLAVARQRFPLGDGDPPPIEDSIRTTMLLLDDLGNERPGPTYTGDLELIVYERHMHNRPTWVTTWCSKDQAIAKYGDGIARRLFSEALVIDCGGR